MNNSKKTTLWKTILFVVASAMIFSVSLFLINFIILLVIDFTPLLFIMSDDLIVTVPFIISAPLSYLVTSLAQKKMIKKLRVKMLSRRILGSMLVLFSICAFISSMLQGYIGYANIIVIICGLVFIFNTPKTVESIEKQASLTDKQSVYIDEIRFCRNCGNKLIDGTKICNKCGTFVVEGDWKMDKTHMNRSLGTKWFTFYTKIRPWFACLTTLIVVSDFLQYVEFYTSYWWMMLYFATSVIQVILAVMVFVKSKGDYIDFVRFVKAVLLFETISVAYDEGVQQYIQYGFEFGHAFIIALIIFLVGYFVWYRLNVKYFEKRIITTHYVADSYEKATYATEKIIMESNKISFCRKCGEKLLDNSKFCQKCGTGIIVSEEETYEV